MPQIVTTEVTLVHCTVVNNQYQRNAILSAFVPDKLSGQLISPTNHIYSEKLHLEFSYTGVWSSDQTCSARDIRQNQFKSGC